jgi:hypothetical protein
LGQRQLLSVLAVLVLVDLRLAVLVEDLKLHLLITVCWAVAVVLLTKIMEMQVHQAVAHLLTVELVEQPLPHTKEMQAQIR